MELALAHIGPTWLVALYLPAERRYLDSAHTYVSAVAALAYVHTWQAQGATIRSASRGAYQALVDEAAAGAALVRTIGG